MAARPTKIPAITVRQSVLLDPASIAPVGSVSWAEECRERLREAVSRAVGGRADFDQALLQFWDERGWTVLVDATGRPFASFRAFACGARPHGLHLTPHLYRGLMRDIHKALAEVVEHAEATPLPKLGEVGRQRNRVDMINSKTLGGTQADYLARRLVRDHPTVFERLKDGQYTSVRQAAKAAGIIKEPSPLQELQRWWAKTSTEERAVFRQWIAVTESEDPDAHDDQPSTIPGGT